MSLLIKSLTGQLLDVAWGKRSSDYQLDQTQLRYAQLPNAVLVDSKLREADLTCANLIGAHLRGADLREADLSCASLMGADLSGADLRGAILTGAWLNNANLFGTDLRGARMGNAFIYKANFSTSSFIDGGQDCRGYRFGMRQGLNDLPAMVIAGCHWFTLAEARGHWLWNPEASGKIKMMEAEAARRGWVLGEEQ